MTGDILTRRQLNRATLARQLLLGRVDLPAVDVVHRFAGLQAQNPRDPYIGLWSRLRDFRVDELERLLLDRRVVRLVVQRGTVHVVTADDCLVLRPLAQPILTQQLFAHRDHGPRCRTADLDAVMAAAATILAEQPRTTRQLRAALAERFPAEDPAAMAFACRNLLAFVQVPPRGLWSASGEVVGTTAAAWLGRELAEHPSVDEVMLRYLAAFGPSTVQDAATWSRYTGLRAVFERLRPRLRTARDEDGREYFDVEDGPRPDAGADAPVRFLPQYDNVLLAHKDRSRFVDPQQAGLASVWNEYLGFVGSVLVDGMLAASWRIDEPTGAAATAVMTVRTAGRWSGPVLGDVEAEARRLLHFVAPDAPHDVRLLIADA